MAVHPFSLDRLPAMPWKNGGGTTREVACQPPGAGMDAFDWRVSIATIGQAGPFSAFAGIDRVILLLAGDGVHLRGDGVDHRLDTPLAPFAFAGDAALDCTLPGGASTDFNVMTRRGKLDAEVRVWRQAADIAPSVAGVLLAIGGHWQCTGADGAAVRCPAGHGLWWHDGAAPIGWRATPLDDAAALIAVRFQPA
jgi:hypothetical protein